jgi:hypothetical protein
MPPPATPGVDMLHRVAMDDMQNSPQEMLQTAHDVQQSTHGMQQTTHDMQQTTDDVQVDASTATQVADVLRRSVLQLRSKKDAEQQRHEQMDARQKAIALQVVCSFAVARAVTRAVGILVKPCRCSRYPYH